MSICTHPEGWTHCNWCGEFNANNIVALGFEVERVRKEHSECIDYYEAKLVEVERKLDEYAADNERLRGIMLELDRCDAVSNWMRVSDDLRERFRAALAGEKP